MFTKWIIYPIGILSILICLGMWSVELAGITEPCIYCQIERTIIGILGIVLLLPTISYINYYLGYVFGFFGASVASNQIFLMIRNHDFTIELLLATCALFIIIGQVVLISYTKHHQITHRGL